MSERIVRSLMEAAVTADLGKLVETLLNLAYSVQNCREKSKILALKVEFLSKSIAELVETKQPIDMENIRRLEMVFKDAVYLLQKYRNRSIFIKLLKAPISEDGFDSVHQRLDICVQYFGFRLQVRNDSNVTALLEENSKLRDMIKSSLQQQQDDMKRLQRGELRSEEEDEVSKTVDGITLEDEVYDEHVLCANLDQRHDQDGSSTIQVLLIYSGDLGDKELAILKRLSECHANILQFFGTYVDGKTKYAVMERPGQEFMTLDEFIENKPELRDGHWSLKKNLALEIALGLQYAHAVGVLHKNIRSPNIFMGGASDEFHPKIFGFSEGRIETSKSDKRPQSKEQVRWKAPEMLSSKRPEYSFKCDIFSLGVVIWEIITWSFPFEQFTGVRKALEARVKKDMKLDFSGLPSPRSTSVQSFMRICEDCMQTDSGSRPSIDEVVDRISQLVPENMSFINSKN